MSDLDPRSDGRRVAAEEAAAWIARLESGNLTAAERESLADWLRASPAHVAELLRIDRLTGAIRQYGSWEDDSRPTDNVIPLRLPSATTHRSAPRRRLSSMAMAASILMSIGLLGWLTLRPAMRHLHTGAEERLEVRLADGSTVRLEPMTDLAVQMNPAMRSLQLRQGEAEFHVAKDPLRPFIVQAAMARVEAVGTIFTVSREATAVLVSVTEGQVRVLPSGTASRSVSAMPLSLDANERVRLTEGGPSPTFGQTRSAATRPGWTDLELAFDEVTVREVIERFNQRNRQKVVILDPALAERKVSGFFNPDDPESFVEFLTVVAGARVTRSGTGDVLVSAPPAARQ
jgi:transmembrane sensor